MNRSPSGIGGSPYSARASLIVNNWACTIDGAPTRAVSGSGFRPTYGTPDRSNQPASDPTRGARSMLTSSSNVASSGSIVFSQNVRSSASALSNVRPDASSFDQGTPRLMATCSNDSRCCSNSCASF